MMIGRLWMPSQDPAARRMAHSVHSYKRDDYGWTYVDLRTLHLTELSRGYDDSEDEEGVIRGTYSTNETHVADRQIIRMMLALPDLVFSTR